MKVYLCYNANTPGSHQTLQGKLMSLQTLQPESIDALLSPFFDVRWSLSQPQGSIETEIDTRERDEGIVVGMTMTPHVEHLLCIDPDDRLDYLKQRNPAYAEQHLDELARVMYAWLDGEARIRMRDSVRQSDDETSSPLDTLLRWLTQTEIRRLFDLLSECEIPDLDLALSYAVCEAYDVACAAYFLQVNRANRPAAFSEFDQTPEDAIADIHFATAR